MELAEAATWLPDLFAWLCDATEPHLQTVVSSAWAAKHYADEEAIRRALRSGKTESVDMEVLAYLQGGPAPGGAGAGWDSSTNLWRSWSGYSSVSWNSASMRSPTPTS